MHGAQLAIHHRLYQSFCSRQVCMYIHIYYWICGVLHIYVCTCRNVASVCKGNTLHYCLKVHGYPLCHNFKHQKEGEMAGCGMTCKALQP